MASKLNNLSDPLTRSLCTFLDPAGLGLLAATNKKFHALALTVETDAGIIQTLVQKQRLFDLGLRVAYESKASESPHSFILRHPTWHERCMFVNTYLTEQRQLKKELLLSQNGRFTSQSARIEERFVCATPAYLFTRKENNLQGRDLDGRLLFNIPVTSVGVQVFELPSKLGRELILLVMEASLQVWDITEKESVVRVLVHEFPPLMVAAHQFENKIVVLRHERGATTLWVYNTDNLEKAPQEMPHPVHPNFLMIPFASSSSLFLCTRPLKNIVACTLKEGAFTYAWDQADPKKARFLCANAQWLVLCCYNEEKEPRLTVVREAQTGRVAGEFHLPFSTKDSATLWGKDILVTNDIYADTLHFWSLPEGASLLSYKFERCKIKQVLVRGKQLFVHYLDLRSGQYRIISWNTPPCPGEAGAPNDLPKLTLIQPERKEEASLCDRIYACVSSIFDWLASLWNNFFP